MADNEQMNVANPFEKATNVRCFKLIVEGKTLFVNPHFLADFSPFFEALCLGQFAEGLKGEAELKDAKYDDVIEMLKVLGADTRNVNKEITVINCIPMITLADKWNIEGLLKRCIFFIETKFPTTPTTFPTTMKLLLACEKCRLSETVLRVVASRLAAFGRKLLLDQQIFLTIDDRAMSCAILAAADNEDYPAHAHNFRLAGENVACPIPGCNKRCGTCRQCGLAMCSSHITPCPKISASKETSENCELDDNFFVTWWNNDRLY